MSRYDKTLSKTALEIAEIKAKKLTEDQRAWDEFLNEAQQLPPEFEFIRKNIKKEKSFIDELRAL